LTEILSQPAVTSIYQDSLGFIWILTQEGLNRFDGRQNKAFRADVNMPGSLSFDAMSGVVEDQAGNLWFGTKGGGLNRYIRESESFEVVRRGSDASTTPYSDNIRSVCIGLNNKIWIGYQDGGFSAFDPETRLFRHYTSQRWPLLTGDATYNILEEPNGEVWISTDGNGLLSLNTSTESMKRFGDSDEGNQSLPSDRISKVLRDSKGNFWVAMLDAGAVRIAADSTAVKRISKFRGGGSPAEQIQTVTDIYEDSEGAVFLATVSGLGLASDTGDSAEYIHIRGLASSAPYFSSIIQDRSGRYWLGSYQGVSTGIQSSFSTISSEMGLLEEVVLSVALTDDGSLWIGSTGGLHRVMIDSEEDRQIISGEFNLARSEVTALLPEGDILWVGTERAGLYKINWRSGKSIRYSTGSSGDQSLNSNLVTSILRDSYGNLWIGTFNAGLNVMRPGEDSFSQYVSNSADESTLSSDTVYVIYQENNGDLWVGTNTGLNRFNFDTGTFERFMHKRETPTGLSSNDVNAIYEDSKARLWVGTVGGGLNMWEPLDRKSSVTNFHHFQSNIGLPSNSVYAIQGDDKGNLWLATSGGLTRFNYDSSQFKSYTVKDGLQSNDFNFGASFRDSEGRLYFGGSKGLNYFNPDQVGDNSVEPPVALTRISLINKQVWFDQPYNELDRLELDPSDYMIGFEFAALDFNDPDKNQYRYQMVGLDKNWIDLGNKNTVDFTNLPSGQYVFRVMASNADGVWNDDGISLDIIVNPPFYLTWWAFFLYIIAALLMVMYVFHRQRQRELLQLEYQATLESDVRARTRDLRRANDKLQSAVDEIGKARQEAVQANQAKSEFLAALSHEIRTPMHGVLGMTDLLLHSGLPERQRGFAESAHDSANELLGLIDNILDFSKIEAGKLELEETTFNLREVVENLCYLYGEMAQAKNIELNLVFRAELRRQLYGDPVRLRQVLQNLLSNAIKFTKRGAVTMIVEEVQRDGKSMHLQFSVEDTGIGMSEEALGRIFEAFSQADTSTTRQYGGTGLGLSIAKQLVDLMGGELAVKSKAGLGTTMTVHLSLTESPIYTDKQSVAALEGYYGEVVAPMPETRAMLRCQLESLSLQVRECGVVEELSVHADHSRVVLVDVGSLYDNATIAQVENLSRDPTTVVLLVAPLSQLGIPESLKHLSHTTKPLRQASLVNDILAAMSAEDDPAFESRGQALLRFSRRILLVEDMAANQEIARAMLESFGCTVDIAKNGEVALDMFQQEEYGLVLMDCQMPVMDGFAATRHIRQIESQRGSGTRRTPVIALTAGKTETEKERCYASGMDRILFKPYSTEQLNGLLAQYFEAVGEVEAATPAAARTENRADVIDQKALDNIRNIDRSGGDALLARVFENFRKDVQVKLDEMRDGVDDARLLGAGAHAIKSMSLNIGAKALSDYCGQCEANWKKEKTADARREIEVMNGHYLDAVRALERVLEASADSVG